MRERAILAISLTLTLLVGCSPTTPRASQSASPGESQPAARKRLVASINSNPTALSARLTLTLSGSTEIESLTHGALATWDGQGAMHPQLGEAIPSIENGLWKLVPDGRMETTWRIKPNVLWHDGTPFTADDLVFTLTVLRDKQVPFFGDESYDGIEGAEAADPRTITVRWKQAFINADRLFVLSGSTGGGLALPMPKHLLERTYLEDKPNFAQVPYWTDEYVGAGPYRVKEFARGTSLTLEAFEQYVLGQPKIDEIEIRFIPDVNALIATILAGAVDVSLGRGLSFEQGQAIRDQWREGIVDFSSTNCIMIFPQFTNPSPTVIGNAQFRRALIQGLDREEMVGVLMGGLSSVAHFRVTPPDPNYREIEPGLVKYGYDPRKATELIEGLGYTKGADGRFLDASNRPLSIEIRSGGAQDYQTKPMFAAADYWQKLGIGVETVAIPEQRVRDLEYRATFPGFELVQQPSELDTLNSLRANHAAVPENNFQNPSGKNYARYGTAEMDALIDRYFTTVPREPRFQAARDIVHRITDEVIWMFLYYPLNAGAMGNRVQNAVMPKIDAGTAAWNAQNWDLRS